MRFWLLRYGIWTCSLLPTKELLSGKRLRAGGFEARTCHDEDLRPGLRTFPAGEYEASIST